MRFSVIIPLYNKEPYVRKALQSVCDQCFKDFELIVVDDGSTDDSYSVAKKELERSHVNYRLIHQNNEGVSIARNNGVTESKGEYICFLDADDWWSPSFLERIDWLIREYPDAGIYGTNYYIINRGQQRIGLHIPSTGYINYCDCYRKMQMPLTSISVAIPTEVFQTMGGFKAELKLGEDFDLWIRIALQYKVAYLDEPLAFYYQDSEKNWRAVGRMHDPSEHMLWNLGYLENEEKNNPDYKRLIDELRTYSLLPYYLSKQYRKYAIQELEKVDWAKQPKRVKALYNKPIGFLIIRRFILMAGSGLKQFILKHTPK